MAELRLPATGPGSADWWRSQLEWSAEVRKDLLKDWRYNANAYRDKLASGDPNAIRVNIDYEKTEQKRHQLFFRVPELKLRPHPRTARDATDPDPATGQPRDLKRAVRIFREVLQRLAGTKGVDTKALLDQILFDVLCPAGIGACKIGYERYEQGTVEVQIGMAPGQPQPGSVLGLRPTPMVPVMGQAPNVVYERYYASRISPAKLLIPADFTGKVYEREADWGGHDFWIDRQDALARGWKIDKELKGQAIDDEDRIIELDRKGTRREQLKCREVFYFASRFDPKVAHPWWIRRLVFVDGMPDPVLHQDFKDQRFDARGRFVAGLNSLPIRILTLRYVSDSPYPPSDCQISRRQADELSDFRTQMVIHRKKAIPMRWYDVHGIIDERVKRALEKGDYYDLIPTDGPGDRFIGEIARAQYPRENTTFIDYLMGDVNRQWALGANQSSSKEQGGTTATEIAAIERATQDRLGAEREGVTNFWIGIMESLAALVQLYADREDYVEIAGEAGATAIEAWNKETLRGEFLFDVVPDSSARPDAAADRDLALNRYNLLANDPYINREELDRDTVEVFGGDPDRLVKPPEPPKPEPPRVSLSIKGDDLNPLMPQYPNVVNLLIAAGIPAELTPPQAQAPTTGPAEVVDRERLRMAETDTQDQRAGGLVGMAGGR